MSARIKLSTNPKKRKKLMYCRVCRRMRNPYTLYQTSNKPLSRLLEYSSVNELCPVCFTPLLDDNSDDQKPTRHNDPDIQGLFLDGRVAAEW